MCILRSTLLSFLFLIVTSANARATVLLPADLSELAREARTIARGTVSALESRWVGDGRVIETLVTLDVADYWKGPLGERLQFRVPGGRIGQYRSITIGAPQFVVGEDVVVFLGVKGPSVPHVLGLNQGLFRLRQQHGAAIVLPQPLVPGTKTVRVVRGDPNRRSMPLAEFEQHVRGLVAIRR
jgi:hypothetical protein